MMTPPTFPQDGATSAVIRELIGTLPRPRITRIGIVGCGVKIHFPWEKACQRTRRAAECVRAVLGNAQFDLLEVPEPLEDPALMLSVLENWKSTGLDGVILFHASYTAGELGAHMGRWLATHSMPVLSWSHPDEHTHANNEANSLCCQNFLLQMWKRLGLTFAWVHDAIDGKLAAQTTLRFARSVRARQRFQTSKVLHAGGSRVTGFYDGETDELSVMRRFGLQFDRIDLEAVHQNGRKFSDHDTARLRDALLHSPNCGGVDVPDEQILRTLRFGLSILDLAREGGYTGCTVKSWPELFDCYGCAIDGAVSMMNDFGFCCAEEGEMNGLISSLALHFLSEGAAIPTMMDLSAVDSKKNTIGIWHCGACPTRILKNGTQYRATRHSILENGNPATAVGLMVEFLLELGPATVARYQSPDASTMFAFQGELVDSPMPFRGAWCEMDVSEPGSAGQVMGTILDAGLDHHWSLGYGHWLEDLRMLNHWLGVAEIPVRQSPALTGLSR
ncbi:MAG: L-fucose/L-arabinose isomerase family protein [Terrimicrobiaceae bacterium]